MSETFFLIVEGSLERHGGGGTKYTDIDEAVQRAKGYLASDPHKYPNGITICAPVMRIKLSQPPIDVTPVNPLTGEPLPK